MGCSRSDELRREMSTERGHGVFKVLKDNVALMESERIGWAGAICSKERTVAVQKVTGER